MFDSTHPAILAQVEGLKMFVADYVGKANLFAATREGSKVDTSFASVLALPMTDGDTEAVDKFEREVMDIVSSMMDVPEGSEHRYAHFARIFQDAADHFKSLTSEWSPSLLAKHAPSPTEVPTITELRDQTETIGKLLDGILASCNETKSLNFNKMTDTEASEALSKVGAIVGVPVVFRNTKAGRTVQVKVPRFKVIDESKSKADKSPSVITLEIDGLKIENAFPNDSGDGTHADFNRVCMTRLNMTSKDLSELFHNNDKSLSKVGDQITLNDQIIRVVAQ